MAETKNYILAVLCADEHIVTTYKQMPDGNGVDVFADSYKRVMTGVSINEISINLS